MDIRPLKAFKNMVQWDIESLVQAFDPSYTRSGYKVKKLQVLRR